MAKFRWSIDDGRTWSYTETALPKSLPVRAYDRVTLEPVGASTVLTSVTAPERAIYVSKSTANGFAAGSDSNTLAQARNPDRQTPLATVKQAYALASAGDTIVINDGSYTTTELGASNYVMMTTNKLVTLRAYRSGQVTFVGTDTSYVVRLVALTVANMTAVLDGIVLDCNNVSAYGVGDVDATSGLFRTIRLINCTILNPTARAVWVASSKFSVEMVGCLHSAGTSRSLIYSDTATAGCSMTVRGCASKITSQNNTQGVIHMTASASGASLTVHDTVVNSSLLSSLTGSGNHDGIAATNISIVDIQRNDVSVVGVYGTRQSAAVRAQATATIPVAATIKNNRLHNGTTGGYGILVGTDGTGTGDMQCNDPDIIGNVVTATLASQTTVVHGIMLGFQMGGWVFGNTVINCGLSLIQKKNLTRAATFACNTIRLASCPTPAYGIGMYAKGAVGTRFINNSVYVNDATSNPVYVQHVQPDDVSGTAASGVVFQNNAIHTLASALAMKFVNVAVGSAATFSNNLYYSPSALPANCFTYGAASYSAVATWSAAQEATAVAADPKFTDPANDNFALQAASGCIGAGVAAGLSVDRIGRAFAAPPSIGAYEYA